MQVTIGLGFASCRLENWHEIFKLGSLSVAIAIIGDYFQQLLENCSVPSSSVMLHSETFSNG